MSNTRKFIGVGDSVLSVAAETLQQTTKNTILQRIIITAGTVDIYDDAAANNNQVLSDLAATAELGIFLENGLRIVTVGASVNITVVYTEV